jgi:L-threonylcarbamoyladenylate synthase
MHASSSHIGTDIQLAAAALRAGELVAIPTETVYGLAANALQEDAVLKIYQAKNRPQFNPLIIHVASLSTLTDLGLHIPALALRLMQKFSPGPLTYVIPASPQIPDIVTAGTGAVAVRIPQHPLTLALLSNLGFPLAAPSANPSGYVSATDAQHVAAQLGDQVSYILDGGPSVVGIESTILSFLTDTPTLLRYGGTALEAIEAVIGPVTIPDVGFQDNPVAPGMLARHYATRHPLIVGDINQLRRQYPDAKIATIQFQQVFDDIPVDHQFRLSITGSLNEAAKNLFRMMREADALPIDLILAEPVPMEGLGAAINDRLKRASTTE